MGVNPNLGPMFHGTAHPFKEGDIVLPPKTAGVYSVWKANDPEGEIVDKDVDEKAYATTSLEWAQRFASEADRHNNFWTRKPEDKGFVFQVEPVDANEPEVNHGRDYTEIKSRKGFRVVKQVK